jgi:hypothetical protein
LVDKPRLFSNTSLTWWLEKMVGQFFRNEPIEGLGVLRRHAADILITTTLIVQNQWLKKAVDQVVGQNLQLKKGTKMSKQPRNFSAEILSLPLDHSDYPDGILR